MMEAQFTITRTAPNDVQQRQLIVNLDDEPFATLLYGDTVTRAIEPGRHRLKADNTWVWKTAEFNVEPGEHARFKAINRAGRLTRGGADVHYSGAGAVRFACCVHWVSAR